MVGLKAGDEKTLEVTFPEQYGADHLAGKARPSMSRSTKSARPAIR
jgi:hypothetical protein